MVMMIAGAVLSSLLTLLVVAVWAKIVLQPRLQRSLQSDFDEQVEKAAQVVADKVEEAVRKGLLDGVQKLPTREVLEGASRNIARTSAGLVADRLDQIFGGKPR